jgi:hypothetical protein
MSRVAEMLASIVGAAIAMSSIGCTPSSGDRDCGSFPGTADSSGNVIQLTSQERDNLELMFSASNSVEKNDPRYAKALEVLTAMEPGLKHTSIDVRSLNNCILVAFSGTEPVSISGMYVLRETDNGGLALTRRYIFSIE